MKCSYLAPIPALGGVLWTLGLSAHAATIAQAGFNDASGINSNITAGSPYAIGASMDGKGVGEPGWSGTWTGGGTVAASPAFEGDGAAVIAPVHAVSRVLSDSLTGVFSIEQYARFAPGARLVAYTEQDTPALPGLQGPIWQAFPDGKFYVIDGVGDGAANAPQEFSGFTWQPDTWYKVTVTGDFAAKTWSFAVNDVPYLPPDPLGYRGTPAFLNQVRYLSEGSGTVFLDALTVVPEPGAAVAAMVAVTGLLGRRARRWAAGYAAA